MQHNDLNEDEEAQPRWVHKDWQPVARNPAHLMGEGWFLEDLSNRPRVIANWQRIRAEGHRHAREFATKLLDQLSGYMGEAL